MSIIIVFSKRGRQKIIMLYQVGREMICLSTEWAVKSSCKMSISSAIPVVINNDHSRFASICTCSKIDLYAIR